MASKTTHKTTKQSGPAPTKSPRPKAKAAAPADALSAIVPPRVANAAAAVAGVEIKPPGYDAAAAKAALEAQGPRLAAFPPDQIVAPRVDVRASALAAIRVYAFVTQVAPMRAHFEALAEAGQFMITNIELLKDAAFIVMYTHAQAEAAGAFKTEAKVPADLIRQASGIEKRMQELCEYKFRRNAEIAPLLSLLSPGVGHRDLALDLIGYADIYEMQPDEVASDTTNYRPSDAGDARRIAGEILAHLSAGLPLKAREAYDLLQRAWTLLIKVYFEVQSIGALYLRYDPMRNERFPSLFTAGRAARSKKKGRGDGAPKKGQGGEGAPPTE
jgi:hypothetical protein